MFFGGQLSDDELLNELRHELRSVAERLAAFSAIYQASIGQPGGAVEPRAFFLSMLMLEYGLAAMGAYRAWLNGAIGRIQSGDYAPARLTELIGEIS